MTKGISLSVTNAVSTAKCQYSSRSLLIVSASKTNKNDLVHLKVNVEPLGHQVCVLQNVLTSECWQRDNTGITLPMRERVESLRAAVKVSSESLMAEPTAPIH